jgi:hypothetical protein
MHSRQIDNLREQHREPRRSGRATEPKSTYEETSEGETEADSYSSSSDNDDPVQDNKTGGSIGVKYTRRPWTEKEESHLKDWKIEEKSDLWIARRLGRTESAVAQHWRILTQKTQEKKK